MNGAALAVILFIILAAFVAVKKHKLTDSGGMGGAVIGILVFLGTGFTGIALLAAFFILGTLATSWGNSRKDVKPEGERRNLGQVLANGGLAGIFGWLGIVFSGFEPLLTIFLAASFASATADTLSSELGTIYGRRFYNILTLRKDQKGLDGVISFEGLVIGVLGSAAIAAIYSLGCGWSETFWVIVCAGTAGNLMDSILGAVLERRGLIKNDAVNFLNTLFAALVAGQLL